MVQLANLGKLRPQSEPPGKVAAAPVKMEIEDPLEEEHGPFNKRSKGSPPPPSQQWNSGVNLSAAQAMQYNLLVEPSPLGLRLRKSPSLLDLIQMRLSQGTAAATSCVMSSEGFEGGKKKDLKSTAVSGNADKLKASNFPASLLRIGTWECVSKYEGDLVAKCYFAKHKLVWEVLEGGLKSKIEIQWSDITALKASCPENGPGTLDIVLARQPLFFRETNPQPRKHTLWQATSDFTGGQASIHRRHFLQCQPGLLSKHFEKLMQCDPRLNSLSRQPEIILECPYFEPRCSVFEDQDESKCHGFDDLKDGYGSTIAVYRDSGSPASAPSTSTKSEGRDPVGRTPDNVLRETPSPNSVMDTRAIEGNATTSETKKLEDTRCWDQFKVPGLRPSMSMSDLVNHIGHCISGQTTPGNPLLPADLPDKDVLEELTQYLLSDSQVTSANDEQSLMSRVNSLCCLLQKDPATVQGLQINSGETAGGECLVDESTVERKPLLHVSAVSAGEGEPNDASSSKQPQPGISRKESYGELLMHLPRITSMPQFLFNIAEDGENQAR